MKGDVYEEIDEDPSKKTEDKVHSFIDKNTAECIKSEKVIYLKR